MTLRNPRAAAGRRLPVLMYHAVQPAGAPGAASPISISAEAFAWQMAWLKAAGVEVLALDEAVACLRQGALLPERAVVLTFDDGFAGLYSAMFPVLQEYGYPATVFIVTGHVGGRNDWAGQPDGIPRLPLLDWEQIAVMSAAGVDFGAHTASHPRLDRIPAEQAGGEITASKQALQERLGQPVRHFAYPYGRADDSVRRLVQAEFSAACGTHLGYAGPASDPYDLERLEILYYASPALFPLLFSPLGGAYLSLRAALRGAAGRLLRRAWN
jgi:peptidoglycan/xylan/chitin deacetylase (PgdA/CDA1 family)